MTTVNVNPTALPPADTGVERKLRAAWRRERRFVHTRGAAYVVAAFVGLALATLGIDWLMRLPTSGRWLLLGLNIAALACTAWRQWWRWLEPYDPVRVALQVEGLNPQLRSLLVSYVQFSAHGLDDSPGVSAALAAAARRQAASAAAPIDFGRIVNFNNLQRLLLASGATLLLLCGLVVLLPDHFAVMAQRMLNPTSDVRYPTRTRLVDMSRDRIGREALRRGQPVTLWIEVEGLVPQRGRLFIRADGGTWDQANVQRPGDTGGRFDHTIAAAYQGFDYYFEVGDLRTRAYRVDVVPPPAVVEARIDMTYPAYTKLEPRSSESLNVSVPAGTRLKWSVTYDRALAGATMYRVDPLRDDDAGAGAPVERDMGIAKLSADGRTVVAELVAGESFNYRFGCVDALYGSRYDSDIQHYVHVTADDAPDVEVIDPGRDDLVATVRRVVDVRFRAGDDYAVASAAIVFRIDDGDEQRIELARYDEPIVEDVLRWALADTVPGLRPGVIVTWAVEVADDRGEAQPALARSAPRRVRIVTEREYQQYIYEWMQRLTKQIEQVHGDETEGSGRVKNLMKDYGVEPDSNEAVEP